MSATATDTHCPYCGLQCGMSLLREAGGWTVQARDFPTNKGGLCRKGWTAAALLASPDRLTQPLLRDAAGTLQPASWDTALDFIAARVGAIQQAHGRDAIGVFGGGGLTNEKAYLLGKFARLVLGTANIDYNGRFCMASAAAAANAAFGIDRGLPFPLQDVAGARTVLLVGANPAETMPPMMQYFEALRDAGGTLIVADPRRTATAAAADLHLPLLPGSDAALALGLLHVALRDGLVDHDYVAARTAGFDAVRRIALGWWPDRAERECGVPAALIERAARLLATRPAMILQARGPEQQSHGVDNTAAFINLALALGLPGRPHSGWGCLTGQGNGQGGREHGQKSDQLPGYRKLADPAHRAAVAAVWGVDPAVLPQPGLSASELLGALGGAVRGLFVFAANVAVSAPDTAALARRLAALDLLVVCDIFPSETAAFADVVLPVTQWAEEDGTMTNLEGRVLRRRRIADPPMGVRGDAAVLQAIADRLGAGALLGNHTDQAAIFAELRRASAGGIADYAGIDYARIDAEDGVFWPCPAPGHPGTPRLFGERFHHPDGLARFRPVHPRGGERTDAALPYLLTTGRVMGQYQSGAQTRRVAELAAAEPEPYVALHPELARGLGIADGAMARVTTRRGSAVLRARHSRALRLDTLFVPFHWGGPGNANLLTSNDALDPISRIPPFKLSAAMIEPAEPAATQGLDP